MFGQLGNRVVPRCWTFDSTSNATAVRSGDHGAGVATACRALGASALLWLACAACGDDGGDRSTRPDSGVRGQPDSGAHAQPDAASGDSGGLDASSASAVCGDGVSTPVIFLEDTSWLSSARGPDQGPERREVTVTGLGRGFPPGFDRDWLDPSDYVYVMLADADKTWTIIAHGIQSFGVEPGDAAEVRWYFSQPAFYVAPAAQLSLYAHGQLAFSYTIKLDVPEGFSIAKGAEQCSGEDRCTTWVSEALIVRGPCGESVEVGSGQRARVCDYDVLPGELKRVTEYVGDRRTTCADHWHKATELTIVRASPDHGGDDAGADDAGH